MLRLQVPGGSADRCGKIIANDVIVSVDGSAVRGRSLQELRDLILGAPGSNISLSFMRGPNPQDPSSTAHNFHVQLMRGSPQYLASLSAPGSAPPPSSSPVAALPSTAPVSAIAQGTSGHTASSVQNNNVTGEGMSAKALAEFLLPHVLRIDLVGLYFRILASHSCSGRSAL